LETSSSRLEILDCGFIDATWYGYLCEDERLVCTASYPDATESPLGNNESTENKHKNKEHT
jgi:hypothetical protein